MCLSADEIFMLALIRSTPEGVQGASDIRLRSRYRFSETEAQAALDKLFDSGYLVRQPKIVMVDQKTVKREFFSLSPKAWMDSELSCEINVLGLPISSLVWADPTDRIPERFHHYFWNSNPKELDLNNDGTYIALRLFEAANNFEAETWALKNVPREKLLGILAIRDVDPKIKRVIEVYCRD